MKQLETQLQDICKTLFKIDEIRTDQNFFDMGATSFSMILLRKEIQAKLGYEFKVVELFKHTTIQKLAQFLGNLQPAAVPVAP